MRSRFLAFLGLAGAGAVNIVLGTLCSRNAWLASGRDGRRRLCDPLLGGDQWLLRRGADPRAADVHPSGHAHGPLLRGAGAARGWGLAAAAGICAQMLLWPARPRSGLRRDAAQAAAALAELLEAELAGEPGGDRIQVQGGPRGGRRPPPGLPRRAASPERADRTDGGADVPRRRARLAEVVSLPAPAFSSVALGRAGERGGSGCDDRGAAGERRDPDGQRRAP